MPNAAPAPAVHKQHTYSSYAVGTYRANEASLLLRRKNVKTPSNHRSVVYLHGASQTPLDYLTPDSANLAWQLAGRGHQVFIPEAGGLAPFGNSTHVAAIGDAVTYAKALGGKSDKVLICGGSMGALGALNYAVRNPQNVSGLMLWIPALDLVDLHDGTYARNASIQPWSGIETAYGQTPDVAPDLASDAVWRTAAVPAYSPNHRRSDFAALGIPTLIWYSDTDNVCLKSIVVSFSNAIGVRSFSFGDAGHSSNGFDARAVADKLAEFRFLA